MKTKRIKRPISGRPPKAYKDKSTTIFISVNNSLILHLGTIAEVKSQVQSYLIELQKSIELEGGSNANL